MFYKISGKRTGKHLRQSFFFLKKLRTIKPATFSKRDFSTDVLLRIFAK